MWKSVALALAIAIAGGAQAQAQTKKELVAKLLQLQQNGIENVGRALAGQTSQRALSVAGQALPRVAPDKREATAKEIQADVKGFYDEVEPMLRKRAADLAPATLAPAYEERFSEEELRTVITWLEAPVSKKFQQVDGEIATILAQRVVADTQPTVDAKLKQLEAKLIKRLGLAPASSAASAPKK